jgi:hypothetical protein
VGGVVVLRDARVVETRRHMGGHEVQKKRDFMKEVRLRIQTNDRKT